MSAGDGRPRDWAEARLPAQRIDGEHLDIGHGESVVLRIGEYSNGRLAIFAECVRVDEGIPGEKFDNLTVNIPEEPLEPGEFFVKTWGEGALAPAARTSGLFVVTCKRVSTGGYVEAEVWRIAEPS